MIFKNTVSASLLMTDFLKRLFKPYFFYWKTLLSFNTALWTGGRSNLTALLFFRLADCLDLNFESIDTTVLYCTFSCFCYYYLCHYWC